MNDKHAFLASNLELLKMISRLIYALIVSATLYIAEVSSVFSTWINAGSHFPKNWLYSITGSSQYFPTLHFRKLPLMFKHHSLQTHEMLFAELFYVLTFLSWKAFSQDRETVMCYPVTNDRIVHTSPVTSLIVTPFFQSFEHRFKRICLVAWFIQKLF